jgi:hypothetical protein
MAQSLNFTEGGNITSEDVEKLTEKLSNVLDNSPGWHKFIIYLELKQLKSERRHFWTSGKRATHSYLRQKKATTTHKAGAKHTWS